MTLPQHQTGQQSVLITGQARHVPLPCTIGNELTRQVARWVAQQLRDYCSNTVLDAVSLECVQYIFDTKLPGTPHITNLTVTIAITVHDEQLLHFYVGAYVTGASTDLMRQSLFSEISPCLSAALGHDVTEVAPLQGWGWHVDSPPYLGWSIPRSAITRLG